MPPSRWLSRDCFVRNIEGKAVVFNVNGDRLSIFDGEPARRLFDYANSLSGSQPGTPRADADDDFVRRGILVSERRLRKQ